MTTLPTLSPKVVTAPEFRRIATAAGWQLRTIELFLRPPLLRCFVAVGDENRGRALVRVSG